ncbi:hypothetical protein E2C01_014025 [Portunus trituberculatus]|uniref:Uncharacterized protein n=1 Tax=Portunus trituberculatus TaxID=210409 RepID=A0A5B7DHQ8_PORTR|nr:hypothetical protein [Portunus trituberculatus]
MFAFFASGSDMDLSATIKKQKSMQHDSVSVKGETGGMARRAKRPDTPIRPQHGSLEPDSHFTDLENGLSPEVRYAHRPYRSYRPASGGEGGAMACVYTPRWLFYRLL